MFKRSTLYIVITIILAYAVPIYLFSAEDISEFVLIDADFFEQADNIINMVRDNTGKVKEYIGWVQDSVSSWFAPWQDFDLPYPNETIKKSLDALSFDRYIGSQQDGVTQDDIEKTTTIEESINKFIKLLETYRLANEANPGTAYSQIVKELETYRDYLTDIIKATPIEITKIREGQLSLDKANQIFKAKKDIKTAAQTAGLDPETFTFLTVPVLNQIYIRNKKLFRGNRQNIDLRKYHQNKSLYSSEERKMREAILVGNYKIHLMPKTDKETISMVNKILAAMVKDSKLQDSINTIKFPISYDDLQNIMDLENERLGIPREIAPIIVIYPATGKGYAQYVLEKMYALFKDVPGRDITPRFNEKVNTLLYYAQGDGDFKREPWIEYFDPNKNYIFYRPDFMDGIQDYSLKYPNS